jgi:hypothetical protein
MPSSGQRTRECRRSYSTKRLRRRTVCSIRHAAVDILALTLFLGPVSALRAQLSYDHTTFLHGYASDSTIWTTAYADVQSAPPAYLSRGISLMYVGYPNLNNSLRYTGQVGNLVHYLRAGGQHVLVAHSLGSLVARGAYLDSTAIRPDVSAIIAVTAPHQGAPLADNFPTLRSYLRDMQRRIQDAVSGFNVANLIYDFVYVAIPLPYRLNGLGPALFGVLLWAVNGTSIDLNNIDQFGAAPAFADLSPGSPVVSHLNSRFDDGSIPRANIYAVIPFRNAALRLMKSLTDDDASYDHLVTTRNLAQEFFSSCKWAGYVIVVTWTSGRRCAYARKTLGRLDERWAKYVNGADAYGNARYVPFDGVVPNERSHYPSTNGVAFEVQVPLVNHINVYKTRSGLDQIAEAMRVLRMQQVQGPPPPSNPVSISGASQLEVGCPGAWLASASFGTQNYSYLWTLNGQTFDTGSSNELDYTPSAEGSLNIQVTVTDSNGATGSSSKLATVTSGNCS